MNKTKIVTPLLILTIAFGIHGFGRAQSVNIDPIKTISQINSASTVTNSTTAKAVKNYEYALPLAIVANPDLYIGKHVKFKAKFDKFSTLGLDYKPAFRSSEKYISLLIQRDDVKDHDVPLSELKIFLDRKEAEKHIDLNSGDEIELYGCVFSKALGDAWMDVDKFNVIKTVPKAENK